MVHPEAVSEGVTEGAAGPPGLGSGGDGGLDARTLAEEVWEAWAAYQRIDQRIGARQGAAGGGGSERDEEACVSFASWLTAQVRGTGGHTHTGGNLLESEGHLPGARSGS